jgi:hypothetical protein
MNAHDLLITPKHLPGQSAQDATLENGTLPWPKFKKLFIAGDANHARMLQRQLYDRAYCHERGTLDLRNGNPHVFVTYPGDNLTGRRFCAMEVPDRVMGRVKSDSMVWNWYQEIAVTRLMPGAEITVTPHDHPSIPTS